MNADENIGTTFFRCGDPVFRCNGSIGISGQKYLTAVFFKDCLYFLNNLQVDIFFVRIAGMGTGFSSSVSGVKKNHRIFLIELQCALNLIGRGNGTGLRFTFTGSGLSAGTQKHTAETDQKNTQKQSNRGMTIMVIHIFCKLHQQELLSKSYFTHCKLYFNK